MARPQGGNGKGDNGDGGKVVAISVGMVAAAFGAGLVIGPLLVGSALNAGPVIAGGALIVIGAGLVIAGLGGIFGGGSTGCFIQGTEVLMADMTQKPIEKISVNDLVLSRHEKTGLLAGRRVSRVFVHEVDSILNFTLMSGETIGTTEAHRFALGVDNFSPAKSIDVGTKLCTEASSTELLRREVVRDRAKVYNFTVEEFNTYFVGQERVWVHNVKDNEGNAPPGE